MSNDIKIADYIPKDGILCKRCIHYEKCPMEFKCNTLDRMLEHYGEDFWSYMVKEVIKEDEE